MRRKELEEALRVVADLARLIGVIAPPIWRKRVFLRRMAREALRKIERTIRHVVQNLPQRGRRLIARVFVLLFSLFSAWFLVFAFIAMADATLKPDLHAWQRLAGIVLSFVVLGAANFYRIEAHLELNRIGRPPRRNRKG